MTTIITRAGKGTPLTNDEMDANLNNLNNDKQETATAVTKDSQTGAAHIPNGTTAERPVSPQYGDQRANSDLNQQEWWNGSEWVQLTGEVTLSTVQTLLNKTLVSPEIDTDIIFVDDPAIFAVNGYTAAMLKSVGALAIGSSGYGEAGQVLKSGGSGASAKYGSVLNNSAAVTASGTAVDFTEIPSWAKRITVVFNEVSLSGTSSILIQLGDSGGIETTGYLGTGNTANQSSTTSGASSVAGFPIFAGTAAAIVSGSMVLYLASTNLWVSSHAVKSTTTNVGFGGGSKTLSDTLTQVRVTTVNGTDTFDAGSISISWE